MYPDQVSFLHADVLSTHIHKITRSYAGIEFAHKHITIFPIFSLRNDASELPFAAIF